MTNRSATSSTLSRRTFLKRSGAVAGLVAGAGTAAFATSKKPNILFILIDDMGWMDLRCQGNDFFDTPNIDKLASQGMRFTDAYAAAPVCSPTRAAAMTGLSPARLGLTNHIPDREDFTPANAKLRSAETLDHLPAEHKTIAERLKEAGYTNAFMGKWHLSGKSGRGGLGETKFYPEQQGFDVNLGGCSLGGPPTYFDPYNIHNLPPRKKGEYLPDRLADEAIAFMSEKRNSPFFVALWHYTVHWPMEAPVDLIEKYTKRKEKSKKTIDPRYGAMVEALDTNIGRIMKALDAQGLTKDTLVIFTSDNGAFDGVADNRPLRAAKGYLYEGGIRVPLIIRQPETIKAGTTCSVPVITTDFYPTLLTIAGLKQDPSMKLDGEDLTPLLSGTDKLKRKDIFFHYPNYAWHKSNRLGGAVRSGDYKLILHYDDDSVELFNLSKDLSEKNNLVGKMPEKAALLKVKLKTWLQETGAKMPEKT